jgi:hypothetical protein
MDALKLAFETVIIGLFAMPWLCVMIDLVNPDLLTRARISHLMRLIPDEMRSPAIGITVFCLVYLVGSMMTPVACQFLDDSDMLGKYLPTEEKIQISTYQHLVNPAATDQVVLARVKLVSLGSSPNSVRPTDYNAQFLHDEGALLLRGSDSCERLNRLHEQLTVLRGATFSAFALMVLCGFAWCGCTKKVAATTARVAGWSDWRRWVAFVVAAVILSVAGIGLSNDRHTLDSGDMPILEVVLLVLGSLGMYVAFCGTRSRLKIHGAMFLFGLCFTLVCYSGYGCTEKSYDQAVYYTSRAIPPTKLSQ